MNKYQKTFINYYSLNDYVHFIQVVTIRLLVDLPIAC